MELSKMIVDEKKLVRKNTKELVFPEIRNWQFCFNGKHGNRNCINVISAFYDFVVASRSKELVVPGLFVIRGNVYGDKTTKDGNEITTPFIRRVFMLKKLFKGMHPNKIYIGVETSHNQLYYIDYQHQFLTTVF